MTEKKSPNKVMILIAVGVVVCFVVILLSKRNAHYEKIANLPDYSEDSQPQDGDTQADTIRALQAYAKEAVGKAEALNEQTRQQQTTVLENRNKVEKLEQANQALNDATDKATHYAQQLESQLASLSDELNLVKDELAQSKNAVDEQGIPVGLGFDSLQRQSKTTGQWYNPIDFNEDDSEKYEKYEKSENSKNTGFTHLLSAPGQAKNSFKTNSKITSLPRKLKKLATDEPIFTLPKDTVLYDSMAMTALIGRIPVAGTTPDPYPVKIFIGKDNLIANGHELPEVDGMIFSGLGIGDWNLSCVSARLYSATFIFEDGSIVNHTVSDGKPLGYISDRIGWPCVSGKFKTNAPKFLRDRIGLAGLSAAGSVYSNAQFTQNESTLTGQKSVSLTGSINKALAGTLVQSATDEVGQWIQERQKQSFDAVIVNPGAAVSVHLEETLAIDRSERNRQLRYARHRHTPLRILD